MADADWIVMARSLRKKPEAERVQHILQVAETDHYLAAKLANRCVTSRQHLRHLLYWSQANADNHYFRYWLESIIQRAGFRRVVGWLGGDHFTGLSCPTIFHLQRLCPTSDRDRAALDRLISAQQSDL